MRISMQARGLGDNACAGVFFGVPVIRLNGPSDAMSPWPSSSFVASRPMATHQELDAAEAKRDLLFDGWKNASARSVELWRRFDEQGQLTDHLLLEWTLQVAVQDGAMARMERCGFSLHRTPPAGNADLLAFQRGSAAINEIQDRLRKHKSQLEPLRRELDDAERATRQVQQELEAAQQEVDRLRAEQARP